MNILLTGCTGFIGNHLLRALLRQGHSITACCRNPERLLINRQSINLLTIDFASFTSSTQWLPYLDGIDVVINCVGIIAESKNQSFENLHSLAAIALFEAAALADVKKVIQISALGADAEAQSPYHLSKKAADDVLRNLPLAWFILQPSIVYGDGAQSSSLLHALAALPVQILPEGGKQLLQPIHIDDLVAVVIRCLDENTTSQQTLALVGSEAVSYADLLQGLRQRLGKPPAPALSMPYRYLLAFAGMGKYLGETILSKDNIAMLSRGNTANADAISHLLQRPPHGIQQFLFEKPATQAERWHAQLYFLKPVSGFVIAIVWLWSGITSLFFYPHELSYQLLTATGVTGIAAPITLYGLAVMDITLGMATLYRYHLQRLLCWQILIVLVYTLVIAFTLPEFVVHPFGALLKNLPFLLCLLIYRQLSGEKS